MKTWIIIALVLSTCAVQVDGGLLKKVLKKVGKAVGSIVKPIFGIDKLEEQAEHGIQSVESGIAIFNGNIDNNLREIQQRIGQSLDNVDNILELSIALICMALAAVCGYELRRVGNILRPSGLVAFEMYLLKWTRIVCFASALLLPIHIILRVFQISIISIPERRNFFFLFPLFCVASYFVIRLLVKFFKLLYIGCYYLFFVMKYLLYLPYTVLYYAFFSPFVLTYRCFADRHHHSNGTGAFVIYCLPVFFCVFYSCCEEIFDTYLMATEKKNPTADYSLTWLYSLLISYVLFHLIAIVLWFYYPPYSPPLFTAELNRRLRARQRRL